MLRSGIVFCLGTLFCLVFCLVFCSLDVCFVRLAKFALNDVRVRPTLFEDSPAKNPEDSSYFHGFGIELIAVKRFIMFPIIVVFVLFVVTVVYAS